MLTVAVDRDDPIIIVVDRVAKRTSESAAVTKVVTVNNSLYLLNKNRVLNISDFLTNSVFSHEKRYPVRLVRKGLGVRHAY